MDESIHIVIPVKDMADHVAQCLATLTGQLSSWDRLTVIDDGSTEDIRAACALPGVEYLRVTRSQGPYAARHAAASETSCRYLLFVDARCRARDGLLDAHRALLRQPGAALSATGTRTTAGGRSFAERVAAAQQPFSLDGKIGVPGKLDFFPTANLGVARSAYQAIGGFRRMRSGADADLCWRIQEAGLGAFAVDERILMDWVPRASWSSLREQWTRYGASTAYLEALYPDQSPAAGAAQAPVPARARAALRRLNVARPAQWPITAGYLAAHLAFRSGYRKARGTAAEPPRTYRREDIQLEPAAAVGGSDAARQSGGDR